MRKLPFVFLMASAVFCFSQTPSAALVITDPNGDTIGEPNVAHDINLVEAIIGAGSLTFKIELLGMVSAPSEFAADSIVGYIDLDLDQDEATGETSNFSHFLALLESGENSESSGLGTEIYVDMFSERFTPGLFEVVDASTRTVIGQAVGTYGSNSLQVAVPLSLLGGDSVLSYGVVVGDFVDLSDGLVGRTVPEPSTLVAGVMAFFLVWGSSRKHQSCSNQ